MKGIKTYICVNNPELHACNFTAIEKRVAHGGGGGGEIFTQHFTISNKFPFKIPHHAFPVKQMSSGSRQQLIRRVTIFITTSDVQFISRLNVLDQTLPYEFLTPHENIPTETIA